MKTGHIFRKSINTSNWRFDASYHLSEGVEVKRIIGDSPCKLLKISDATERIFIGGRNKRIYVSSREHGIPFLSSSDILQADLENVKLASKKYTPDLEGTKLQKGWTLISRSGTVGNCAFATAKHAQKLASEHVIRLVPNNILRKGYIFAYLASKHGYSLLTQGTFGAVIQHIEPDFIGSLPIPQMPEAFQQEIDDLIQESARLREAATDALNEAISYFDNTTTVQDASNLSGISIKSISSGFRRFDAQYHLGNKVHQSIIHNQSTVKIGKLAESIFIGNRDKRLYVERNGVPFLSSSDMMYANPQRWCKQISKKAKALSTLQVQQNDILISRSGTIGNTIIVGNIMNGYAVSEHALRLRIDYQKIEPEYVFAFLRSKVGQHALSFLAYGSVIITLGENYVADIDLPLLDSDTKDIIVDKIKSYSNKWDKSITLENKAISMVEQEIEKWNK